MANAIKCDRCGKCFDPYHMKGDMCRFKNPVFQNSDSLKEVKTSGFLYGDSGPDSWVDLCPACSQAFTIFMSGGELEKKDGEKSLFINHAYEKTTIALEKFGERLSEDLMDVFLEMMDAAYGEEGKADD